MCRLVGRRTWLQAAIVALGPSPGPIIRWNPRSYWAKLSGHVEGARVWRPKNYGGNLNQDPSQI